MVLLIRLALCLLVLPFLGNVFLGDTILNGTFLTNSKLGLISRRNQARKQAELAYRQGHYEQALAQFRTVLETGQPVSAIEHLAAAHIYFRLRQFTPAAYHYGLVSGSVTAGDFSIAAAQLGVLACYRRDTVTALSQFRRALLSDPQNVAARLNYEWLKPRYTGKKQTENLRQQLVASRQKVAQQLEKSERQQTKLNPFRDVNMTEEQARRVLDALRNDDLPYVLARRRQLHHSGAGTAGRW